MDIKDNSDNIISSDSQHMLTTIDNPYNPFTQFELWYTYDISNGHNSLSYLARIAKVSNSLSEKDYSDALENAIDEIVSYNITGLYRKVTANDFEDISNLYKSLE